MLKVCSDVATAGLQVKCVSIITMITFNLSMQSNIQPRIIEIIIIIIITINVIVVIILTFHMPGPVSTAVGDHVLGSTPGIENLRWSKQPPRIKMESNQKVEIRIRFGFGLTD